VTEENPYQPPKVTDQGPPKPRLDLASLFGAVVDVVTWLAIFLIGIMLIGVLLVILGIIR
jgi:hypothetical protein